MQLSWENITLRLSVMYFTKIISKLIANRFKEFISELISENQNAFIKGRRFRMESYSHMKWPEGSQLALLEESLYQIDLKAFDSVRREHILNTLSQMAVCY